MIETISRTPPLTESIRERIRREGPITFHDWMKVALYDPGQGYYCNVAQKKWGREGDYRTSPERSSLFASTFARYFAGLYEGLGRPSRWTIVEAGAGDGRFAHGMLQTLYRFFPAVFAATRFVVNDISRGSIGLARDRLQSFSQTVEFSERLGEFELDPGIVFSNELLDAFPVHRVSMHHGELQEFYVDTGANEDFCWTLGPLSTPRLREYFEGQSALVEGQVVEANLGIEDWFGRVAARLRHGYIITVDYGLPAEENQPMTAAGSSSRSRETLRSFYRHQIVDDLLSRPGEQDLTASVDWTSVKRAGERLGFEVKDFARQDKFLLSAGLLEQLELESKLATSDAERLQLTTAAREMILPDGMAASFQVLVQKKK